MFSLTSSDFLFCLNNSKYKNQQIFKKLEILITQHFV